MTREAKRRNKAELYFISIGAMPPKEERTEKWILHHIDESWKYDDPKRYSLWNIEDLIPLTMRDHNIIHKKGILLSEEHKLRVSESLKGHRSWNVGKHWVVSEEGRKNISESHKGISHPQTDITRLKISDANIGKHWFNNSICEVFLHECPDGFTRGRLKRKCLE